MPENALDRELLIGKLARLLYGENRQNMTEEEALAMGDTVLNRPELAGFAASPEEVISQPRQYGPFNPDDPNAKVVASFGPQDPRWQEYVAYAEKILAPERQRSDFTHYFTGKAPTWAQNLEGLTRIGSHYFGREKRRKKKR